MKKFSILLLICILLTGCKKTDPTLIRFRNELDSFCENIQIINDDINAITNISSDEIGLKQASNSLLYQLDLLKDEFVKFSNLDFPSDYDYLEPVADEAAEYMTEAVGAYHKAFAENYTVSMEEYAHENYARAYKRVQVILDALETN